MLSLCLLLVAWQSLTVSALAEDSPIHSANFFIPGTTIDGYSFGGDEANRLAKNNVFIGSDSKNNYLDLASGNVLLHPDKDMVVGTGTGKLHIGAGAVVFIIDSGNDLVVYNLKQTKVKQVAIITGKYKLFIEPGRLLVLTSKNSKNFELLTVNCHSISYQNAKKLDLPDAALNIFTADFSIASAFDTIQPLKGGSELAVKQRGQR